MAIRPFRQCDVSGLRPAPGKRGHEFVIAPLYLAQVGISALLLWAAPNAISNPGIPSRTGLAEGCSDSWWRCLSESALPRRTRDCPGEPPLT